MTVTRQLQIKSGKKGHLKVLPSDRVWVREDHVRSGTLKGTPVILEVDPKLILTQQSYPLLIGTKVHIGLNICELNTQQSLTELVCFQDGETPLHIASSRGHLDCVRYLLDARAEVDVPNDAAVGGNTPLHLSIMRHYTNVAMLLLHAGADFDLVNSFYF